MKIDKKIIKELSDYLNEFNLTELEYTEKDTKIKVSKNNVSINNQSLSSNNNLEAASENLKTTNNKKLESNILKSNRSPPVYLMQALRPIVRALMREPHSANWLPCIRVIVGSFEDECVRRSGESHILKTICPPSV